jgi:SNF2 family DNA or RNA helicase
MWVLHAHWRPPKRQSDSGEVLFWAEDLAALTTSPATDHPAAAKAHPHPFGVAPEALRQRLGEGTPLAEAQPAAVVLHLPSDDQRPWPSPALNPLYEIDQASTPRLRGWQVAGLTLPLAKAFTILTTLPAEGVAGEIRLGADTRYWQVVCNLVLEILAQQKYLPTLQAPTGPREHYLARWLPVLDGPNDAQRLDRLEQAMPPLCRAERRPNPRGTPFFSPARALLDDFIRYATDALVRTWGRSQMPLIPPDSDQVQDRWLEALFRPDPMVRASLAQVRALHSTLQAWLRNLHVAGDEHFRVAFLLEAPPASEQPSAEGTWELHYLLQSRSDPSLLISAEDIWFKSPHELVQLSDRLIAPQERLLAGLGYAARFFPPILTSLAARHPTGISLDTPAAYRFLREVVPILEQAGFGILTPPWWNQRGARLGVRVRLKPAAPQPPSAAPGLLDLRTLVQFEWEIALGETALTREAFEALVALKSPLVQVRGQWVLLDSAQVEAAIRFWEKQRQSAPVTLLEATRLALGTEQVHDLPVDEVQAEGWLAEWLERLKEPQRLSELPPPRSLRGELRPYQRVGFSWLAFFRRYGLGACLADDMGLGKTIQTLALLLYEKEQYGQFPAPVLLVCPTSVVTNWQREAERFAPSLRLLIHQGPNRLRDEAFRQAAQAADMVVTSYALLRQDQALLESLEWFGVILDEAQNIKNPSARQSQAARRLKAQFRLALTGTPVENRLDDLWSIMHFLNPGYLGSLEAFRREFVLPVQRFGNAEAAQRLRRMVAPFILRRVKTDPRVIQDLPEKIEVKQYCTLSEEQATLYQAVVDQTLARIEASEGMQRRGLILSMITQLKQVCNHPAQFLHQPLDPHRDSAMLNGRSGKLNRLIEMLDEVIAAGDRALVFTQFAEMGELLAQAIPLHLNVPVYFLHGGTPPRQREQMVRRFQEDDHSPPVFILSLKAGGLGLNLTRATYVFHFDRWWNPAVENQATDRAFRIGQTRNVQVHKLITQGTLEERIDDLIESKIGLAQSIIGEDESWLTELSNEQLRDLVMLRTQGKVSYEPIS